MSNVLKRHRNLSDYAFYNNALKLRSEIMSITNNEKYVPKRRRIVIGNKTLNHALDIVECIAKANSSYPASPEMLFIRKWYQQKAIGECEALIECIRVIMEFNNTDKNKRLMSIVYLTSSEIDLLKRWMKATKLTKHTKKYLTDQEAPAPINDTNSDNTSNDALSATDKSVNMLLVQLMLLLEESSRSRSQT